MVLGICFRQQTDLKRGFTNKHVANLQCEVLSTVVMKNGSEFGLLEAKF